MRKTTLGVIVGNRAFFADSLVGEGRKEILALLREWNVDTVALDDHTTQLGAVETWADAQKCADLFRRNRDKIDGIMVFWLRCPTLVMKKVWPMPSGWRN